MKQPEFTWIEDTGMAIYTIFYNNKEYTGEAMCAEADLDMCNSKTGLQIASWRAELNLLIDIKENLKVSLETLIHLRSTLLQSPNLNPEEKAYKAIEREIHNTQIDLKEIREEIKNMKKLIKQYIDDKDHFYKTIRAGREKGKSN